MNPEPSSPPGPKQPAAGTRPRRRRWMKTGPLEYIAFWQFMSFILLLCLIWAQEVLDLPRLIFGVSPSRLNLFRACLLTAGVIVVGFIVVAHAYVQQKRVLKGLIKVCSYCRMVEVEESAWRKMEEFVADRTLAEFTHGVCPACYARIMRQIGEPVPVGRAQVSAGPAPGPRPKPPAGKG